MVTCFQTETVSLRLQRSKNICFESQENPGSNLRTEAFFTFMCKNACQFAPMQMHTTEVSIKG
jgi:hypothetical protein